MSTTIHITGLNKLHDNAQSIITMTGDLRPFCVTTSQVEEYIESVEVCLKEMQEGLRMVKEFNLYLKSDAA